MDLLRRLQSILAPPPIPANDSYQRRSDPAGRTPSFSIALADATGEQPAIEVTGVRPARSAAIGPSKTAGPTVLPDPEPREVAVGPSQAGLEEAPLSLGEALTQLRGAPTIKGSDDGAGKPPASASAASGPEAAAPTTPAAALPPLGVLWSSLALRGSGASGPGIGGTDAEALTSLIVKHGYYSNPSHHGVKENQEARLFRDAVAKGYVDDSAEGLGTLLSYLSKGSFGPDSRPPTMTAYFNQFYAAERAAGH